MKKIVAFSPGKLLLFGEHAILYGHPALGSALPAGLQLEFQPETARASFIIDTAESYRSAVQEAFSRIAPVYGLETLPPGRLRIQSTLPVGSGFGSSAALCVGLSKLLAELCYGDSLQAQDKRQLIWQAAHEGEKYFHGTSSGIDTALAVFGRTLAFRSCPGALPDIVPLETCGLTLVYGSVPRRSDAKQSIARLAQLMSARDARCLSAMDHLGSCASSGIALLQEYAQIRPTSAQSAELVRRLAVQTSSAQLQLAALGLSTPELDALLSAGLTAGALAGKLSGAGAGGAFWLLARNREAADTIAAAVRQRAGQLELPGHAYVSTLPV